MRSSQILTAPLVFSEKTAEKFAAPIAEQTAGRRMGIPRGVIEKRLKELGF